MSSGYIANFSNPKYATVLCV